MSRLEEEKAETEIREALVPKFEEAPQGPVFHMGLSAGSGSQEGRRGEDEQGLWRGWASGCEEGGGKACWLVAPAGGSGRDLCGRVPAWALPLDHRAGAQDG